ncbi:Ecdysteroid UDP-glucosyltransferase [Frankliniella fusca]|uniref:Ecdysteroid UDP-glucosyltransferase n=1 Tax=Frankliniella fusca TaxID=407009 RepID=A0AAE1LGS9_9NEOP|nr:Ecdysteroid UDP-glucosyltransferase [Frankliniella fusca]
MLAPVRLLLAVVLPGALLACAGAQEAEQTAVDVARQVYAECLQRGSVACVRPRVLAFLAEAKQRADKAIRITRDLSVVPCADGNALDNADDDLKASGAPLRRPPYRH